MNCSPPGSSVHGILQAKILEWIAMPSSRRSSWLRNQTRIAGVFFTHWATCDAQAEHLRMLYSLMKHRQIFASLVFFIFYRMIFISVFIFGCAGSSVLHRRFSSWGEKELLSRCPEQASPCGGFSRCGARALGHAGSAAAVPGLWSTGLVVVVHVLSCSAGRGILPDQDSNLSSALLGGSFT